MLIVKPQGNISWTFVEINVVCCVGRVEIHIEIQKNDVLPISKAKSNVLRLSPSSEKNFKIYVSLWRSANTRTVRLRLPYRQLTKFIIFSLTSICSLLWCLKHRVSKTTIKRWYSFRAEINTKIYQILL